MRLDRNLNPDGRGKYALLKLRQIETFRQGETFGNIDPEIVKALDLLEKHGILDWGNTPQTEFFVVRLKDRYAEPALWAYAAAAALNDKEYANEIYEMAKRSGRRSPWCKRPD